MNSTQIHGVAAVHDNGELLLQTGVASHPRIRALIMDSEWRKGALARRVQAMQFTDEKFLAVTVPTDDCTVILLFGELSETVLRFFLSVDFAFDILEHLLADPFDAMIVVDKDARLAFVSPIHEKFFGLQPGEAVGRKVAEIIQNTQLPKVVRSGKAEIGQIQKMNGRERVVSRHPIRHNGKIAGAIGRVMFKGPEQVEALARRINALEQEIKVYKERDEENRHQEACLEAIIGQSASIAHLRDQIRKIGPIDIPVLIQGESGTGKELVAQALHALSAHRNGKLVTVNSAALPAQLVESELFGYEAGSFTGADRRGRAGKFEQANEGTLFLDEIGDMPLEVQAKLLRVLQDRMVERVGSSQPRKINFRLCAATNHNLEEAVARSEFRLDLFYRISPVVIHMPTLSDRLEDIPLLVDHFLHAFATHYSRKIPRVTDEVIDYLQARPWPGNVRELRHVVERAFVFCEDDVLTVENFAAGTGAGRDTKKEPPEAAMPVAGAPQPPALDAETRTLRDALERYEQSLISDAMERFDGNKKKVAEHLGISRTHLYKKLASAS